MSGDEHWLRLAIQLAEDNAAAGGRPFGAVVVRNGSAVATGVNRVVQDGDPTAHAETEAIRAAAVELGTTDLRGTLIAASTEPCPMCQAAALLVGVERIVFATTELQAAERGYDAREQLADLALPLEERQVMRVEHRAMEDERRPYDRVLDA
jgi:tRNA(Arg) A34 adenosine deaminase TadA